MAGFSMLRSLVGRHRGQTIAVVGSAPSARAFRPGGGPAIAVNGAISLGPRFDYFLCADPRATTKPWFRSHAASIRILARNIADSDPQLYPDTPRSAREWTRQADGPDSSPVSPHVVYELAVADDHRRRQLARRETDYLIMGGTISAQAAQLAYLMGAAQIHLHGCEFSMGTSGCDGHYFYASEASSTGRLRDDQRAAMDALLAIIRAQGVRVHAHGPTRLTEIDVRHHLGAP